MPAAPLKREESLGSDAGELAKRLGGAKEWCDKAIKLSDGLKNLHASNVNYAKLDSGLPARAGARALLHRGHVHLLTMFHVPAKGKKVSARAAQKDLEAALQALEACGDGRGGEGGVHGGG